MSLFQEIYGALLARARTADGIPTEESQEGSKYSPVTGTPFVGFTLTPTGSRPATIGRGGLTLHEGLFIVSLFYPNGTGVGAAAAIADAVRAKFVPGDDLTQGASIVRIRYSERAQAVIDNNWLQIPVNIGWSCHSPTS